MVLMEIKKYFSLNTQNVTKPPFLGGEFMTHDHRDCITQSKSIIYHYMYMYRAGPSYYNLRSQKFNLIKIKQVACHFKAKTLNFMILIVFWENYVYLWNSSLIIHNEY